MAVTIQKIAELSGVSRGTVDRVLHGRPNVNPMIREKVVRAAEKLGYQPPVPPKSADCRQAAILIPQWTDGYFNRQIVSGIRKALRYIADPAFILTEQPLRTMTMQELLRAMDEQIRSGVDGLIIRAENTPEVRAAIEQAMPTCRTAAVCATPDRILSARALSPPVSWRDSSGRPSTFSLSPEICVWRPTKAAWTASAAVCSSWVSPKMPTA